MIETDAWDIFTAADRVANAARARKRHGGTCGRRDEELALALEDAIADATATVELVKASGADMPAVWRAVNALRSGARASFDAGRINA